MSELGQPRHRELPRKTDMRGAMNAIFYLLRTGCPWRYLPRDEFPPKNPDVVVTSL
jgi:transposase